MKKTSPFEVPSGRPARGRADAPASKSHAIRLLVCAAAGGGSWDGADAGADPAEDIAAASRALAAMATAAGTLPTLIDLGGSATAFRFCCALAALRPHMTVLTGDETLLRRPMDGIVEAVRGLGVTVEATTRDAGLCAPLVVSGGPPTENRVEVDAFRSSHPLSALLLIGPAVTGGLEVRAPSGVASRPYVDLTVWTMGRLGVPVWSDGETWRVPQAAYGDARAERVVGDWSSAAFLTAAAAVIPGDVQIGGLEWDSPQADRRVVDLLRDFGAVVERTQDGVRVRGGDRRPLDVDLRDAPDLAPLVGALGCVAAGTTRVRGAAHLRLKESDRIATVVAAARALGCEARELPDGFEIDGPAKHGGLVETHHDHRIAMAFAVAGLAVPGVVIDDPACVAKSYPAFWDDLERLIA